MEHSVSAEKTWARAGNNEGDVARCEIRKMGPSIKKEKILTTRRYAHLATWQL
jgi:hypothetical protein